MAKLWPSLLLEIVAAASVPKSVVHETNLLKCNCNDFGVGHSKLVACSKQETLSSRLTLPEPSATGTHLWCGYQIHESFAAAFPID